MKWVEGREGGEGTLPPPKRVEQLLYLPPRWFFFFFLLPPFSILSSPHALERNFYSAITSLHQHGGNKARPLP